MSAIAFIRVSLGRCAGLALPAGLAWAQTVEDIRDIRGPKTMFAWPWFLMAMLLGVLLVALYAAHAIWGRRGRVTRGPELTLSEQTLGRLEDARRLMDPAKARDFGIALSEVIRDYIEKRFEVIATQRTTEEFLQALLQDSNEALLRHRALLCEFLQQCDFVKFAGASIAVTDLESLFVSARGFVLQTDGPAA